MQPLNAIDAIAPAFTRTHQTLFHPFRIGRSWKLAASQYLGFCGAMFFPLPLVFLLIPASVPIPHLQMVIFSLIPTIVMLIFVYLFGRMELVCFEMIVTRAKFIAPMWRRYSARVWPWLGLKILVGTLFTLLIGALLAAPLRHAIEHLIALMPMTQFPRGETPDPVAMQAAMQPFIAQMVNFEGIIFAIFLLLKIPSTLLNDFVLPFFVLEDITLVEALRRGAAVFVADPLQLILYLILKPILFVIGYMIQYISTLIVMIPLVIVMVIVGLIFGISLHGAAGGALGIVALVVGYLLFIVVTVWLTLGLAGYLFALFEAYGIYFLGGRYPLLGEMLEPSPSRPFTPPPVFPSSEERRDDDGGPPMPMDPAVA